MIDKVELNRLEYGDRIKTESGFTITFNEFVGLSEEEDGRIIATYNKPKSYGRFTIQEEVIALYKRTCKLKRKK